MGKVVVSVQRVESSLPLAVSATYLRSYISMAGKISNLPRHDAETRAVPGKCQALLFFNVKSSYALHFQIGHSFLLHKLLGSDSGAHL